MIAEGEVLQLTNIGNPSISEADYFETIQGKTAMLFEAASHSGAVLKKLRRSRSAPCSITAATWVCFPTD